MYAPVSVRSGSEGFAHPGVFYGITAVVIKAVSGDEMLIIDESFVTSAELIVGMPSLYKTAHRAVLISLTLVLFSIIKTEGLRLRSYFLQHDVDIFYQPDLVKSDNHDEPLLHYE